MEEFNLGAFTVIVRVGDITRESADAICNPANSLMYMGGGAAGALKRAGGEEIEKEALRHAPVPVGRAVATTAGRLNARWVIHSPTMERPAMPTTQEKVRMAVLAALRCADEVGAESLVMPGMGTGVGGLSSADAAEAMISALRGFTPKALRRIILCDRNEGMVSAWLEKLK
ncbi:MAG: macro domain-containing protein [Candidatus Hadarchaeales archaeon]